MCLNLIQDELTAKFHWLSIKLGFSKEDDDDDDADEDEEVIENLPSLAESHQCSSRNMRFQNDKTSLIANKIIHISH